MKNLIRFFFTRSLNVTRLFDAKTRTALDLAAASAQAKRLARLA
jgi:hypothetical protein